MHEDKPGFGLRLQPSLFWRTFGLIQLLLLTSILVWFQTFLYKGEEPLAKSVGSQVATIVSIVQQSIENTDPAYLPTLLERLAKENGISLFPRMSSDTWTALPPGHSLSIFEREAREQLPAAIREETIFASAVKSEYGPQQREPSGLFITVPIEGYPYWLHMPDNPMERHLGWAWLGWLLGAIILSVFGAVVLTRYLTHPLLQLSAAAKTMGRGDRPDPLPTDGPAEIRSVNASFNRMVDDLYRLGHDREVLLAGISHDLRTPLTRLRLETEMADLPEETREAMVTDMDQMNTIVDQFLAYSRGSREQAEEIDLGVLIEGEVAKSRIALEDGVTVGHDIEPGLTVLTQPREFSRVILNLITNAARYGRCPDGTLAIRVEAKSEGAWAVVRFSDHGPGIPEAERGRVLRPFERGESARSNAAGSGLGLSIVDRFVRRWAGKLALADAPGGGLMVEIRLPLARAKDKPAKKKPAPKSAPD